ncbi:uncharacterized protein LOC122663364 [Telopea speciosissima]|uniref:uncharacterized protein LOC122663364 n=1 Tax=Telopea speciosissima TaxID=54955 RepID=UPI001CC79A0A|nr:uncharacterized protein LOC122663364 [Telopea speciosissima]
MHNSSQTAVLGSSSASHNRVTFDNRSSTVMHDSGVAFTEIGMPSRCRSASIVRSTTTITTIVDLGSNDAIIPSPDPTNPSASRVLEGEEQEVNNDTSDSDYVAREFDDLSDSSESCDEDYEEFGSDAEEEENSKEGSNGEEEDYDAQSDIVRDPSNRIHLTVGQLFRNGQHFREVLKDYEVQECFKTLKIKNEGKKVSAICAGKGCPWKIYASRLKDGITFAIKIFTPTHTCVKLVRNKEVSARWIAGKIGSKIRSDPDMSMKTMEQLLSDQYALDTCNMQLYRAKWIALGEDSSSHKKTFRRLESYADMIMRANIGNQVAIEYQNGFQHGLVQSELFRDEYRVDRQFRRLFVCFNAWFQGFLKGCRPFLGLDGCHLKEIYGGVLVSAVSMDENNGMYPIAYGVLENESIDSWLFFLSCLHDAIGLVTPTGLPYTFMTDKQKGLIEAIAKLFPEAHHRHCCRHLYNNFKSRWGNGI